VKFWQLLVIARITLFCIEFAPFSSSCHVRISKEPLFSISMDVATVERGKILL